MGNAIIEKTYLAERVLRLEEPATLAMASRARQLKEKGIDVINLSLGEPDFFTPDFIKEAAKQAIDQNYSYYSPVCGYSDLREAIAEKLKRDNNLNFTPNQIIVSAGAKQAIANTLLSIINPGDEVIIIAPYWVSYSELVKLADGIPVIIEANINRNFKITPQQLQDAISEHTKAFIICSPSNPTGAVYSREELKQFVEVLSNYPNIVVISDEIYEHISFVGKHVSIAEFTELHDRVVVVNGASKSFAMPGWRIGYLAAPLHISKACEVIQGQITSGASSIAQRAALAAISRNPDTIPELKMMVDTFRQRRDIVFEELKKISMISFNKPEGAFYVFINIEAYLGNTNGEVKIKTDNDLCMFLLNKAHVALVPGSAFGTNNYIRLSYATSTDKLVDACDRIKKALEMLY